ncbi:amidase [Gordonia sp. CPCC 205515]|uniref:amidase n=1 Tax=Gordonia sp. CPCC 205515 TaxID=3140791 RepID=UPI003AF3E58B
MAMTDIVRMSACDLRDAIAAKELSAREVTRAHLDRIDAVNPAINAIVTLDSDGALAAADAADRALAAGVEPGPLHGLPVTFKDTHATAGMRTTLGSPLFADNVPTEDAETVRRIGAAGAIRLGKTNVPEMAAGSHTFNSVFGTTVNPYDTTRSAGGSSGGAAAALAARMTPLADGSDMGGSLRNPASFCNVVGLRPTPGIVPSPGGGMGFSPLGVLGPMGRTVDDVTLLLSVMGGGHPHDPLTTGRPAPTLDAEVASLGGLRAAWAPTLDGRIPVEAEVLKVLEPFVGSLGGYGVDVEPACPDLDAAERVFRTLRAAEFALEMSDALAQQPEAFKPDLAWNIRCGEELGAADVAAGFRDLTMLHCRAADFFEQYDVLLVPTCQVLPFDASATYPTEIDGVPQHTYLDWMRACYLLTPLGIPALSLPVGFTDTGLPVGIQVLTAAHTERRLLSISRALEALTNAAAIEPHLPV